MDGCKIRGSHPVIRAILSVASCIAGADVGVLIIGERGTGKDLLARHIHAASPRHEGPFVRLDCQELATQASAIDLCNELRPDVADAGAVGIALERARGGTLFVDHITAFGSDLQVRLMSSLLGGITAAGVRLLAARDLDDAQIFLAAAELGLVEITIPALRQRRSDIPVLVRHFLDLYAARHGVPERRVDTEAMVALWQYDWPGNVRELECVVERVVVLSRSGVICAGDLPPHVRMPAGRAGMGAGGAAGNGHAISASPLR
jgi:DNA-binding NtrC family response regulator